MAAYVISEVESLDESFFERYRALAAASIEQFGGRYLVRGAIPDVVEDEILPRRRLVIVEFPDMATARRWYASSSYAEALAFRDRALTRRLMFVEGI
ncbi:DUF1330 domain-containing protein [Mycolicibacterium sp. 050158]|jgi:uncharacterized protein (DUF1330 family)|uniref:DUF1330 domain-containing protein n=1 Tax=Mycolicibacterium sp. 050158 TaxID=3090602 RepID=UPI00299D0988|nr:DUF1330 domain-containing protein [Mycolicibacterium sp. 050158]MDX1891419.1 DUF1330 domain-containing protein [Mycolicibacterium sp. 050158]